MNRRGAVAEGVGTGVLAWVVLTSGSPGGAIGAGAPPMAHAVAVGCVLVVLVWAFLPLSGAHFNPAVTVAMWRRGSVDTPTALAYVIAQLTGALVGLAAARIGLGLTPFEVTEFASQRHIQWAGSLGEVIGTAGLVAVISLAVDRKHHAWLPALVGGWVAAMVLATGGILNPALTIAREFTDTASGVGPASVRVVSQFIGVGLALLVVPRISIHEPVQEGA